MANETQPLPELLTVREVADLLRFTPRRVCQLAREGHLPAISIPTGKRVTYRFTRDSIEEFLGIGVREDASNLLACEAPDA